METFYIYDWLSNDGDPEFDDKRISYPCSLYGNINDLDIDEEFRKADADDEYPFFCFLPISWKE